MAETEDRVRKLEIRLACLITGGIVTVVAIGAFLGATNLYHIPKQVRQAVSDSIPEYVKRDMPDFREKLQGFLAEAAEAAGRAKGHAAEIEDLANTLRGRGVRVQTGSVSMHRNEIPSLQNIDRCPKPPEEHRRGHLAGRVNFPEPFVSPPEVLMAFAAIATAQVDRGNRLVVETTYVDKEGFDYVMYTWCNSIVTWVRASWIAVAK